MLSRRSMVTGAGSGAVVATAALALAGVPSAGALAATTSTPNWINVGNAPYNGNVNSALAAASATNNVLYFPAGTSYTISSTLNISFLDLTFIGDGAGSSIITSSVSAGDTIYANNVSNFSMYGLTIQAPTGAGSGAVVHFGYASNVYMNDVTISGGYIGVEMDASSTANGNFRYVLRDFLIVSTVSTAIVVGSNGATGNHPPSDVFLSGGMISSCGAGLSVNCTGGIYVDNVDIAGCTAGAGVTLIANSGQWITTARFTNVLCDTSHGEGWIVGGAGAVNGIELHNCWGANNTLAGIDINGSGVNGVSIIGGYFSSNGQDGIRLDAGTNIIVNGASAFDNNTTNTGYSGITIQSGSGFQIANCVSGTGGVTTSGGGTNKQAYGIAIFSSTSNNFIVTGNRLPGNVTGGFVSYATGANQVVANNINF